MTHNMKQFVIDGNKCVLNKPTADQKVEDGEFEENEVYAIDIVVSTGAPPPPPPLPHTLFAPIVAPCPRAAKPTLPEQAP